MSRPPEPPRAPNRSGGRPVLRIAVEGRLDELTRDDRERLLGPAPDADERVETDVRRLLEEVRTDGDRALLRMAREFDGVEPASLEIQRARWREAAGELDPAVRAALERAARNLEAFHRAQVPGEIEVETEPGVRVGRRAVPLGSVGVYAPGGTAAYPSSVLMGVVPARTAGVPTVVVCSPPGPSGEPAPAVLAACEIAGADRLFAVGGAGAVAALAWGTDSVPRVDAIVGPGNRWVTEAKRQVAGRVRIDSPAGPSEVLVVAAPGTDPDRVAAEVVAQAEHDPLARTAVVTWDGELLEAVRNALAARVAAAARRDVVEAALAGTGALLLARGRGEALSFANAYAAEHLVLYTDDPRGDLGGQTTAGTVFLGEASSVAFGDYMTGANHVLPTAGRARSYSGLSTLDFVRFVTWQEVTPGGARALADDVAVLARAEGLPAHAEAAELRSAEGGARRGRGGSGERP